MSGFSRSSKSHNKLWNIKDDHEKIFTLYSFLELNKHSFIDIFQSKHEYIDSLEREGNPTDYTMAAALENACLDFAFYIRDIESNRKINTYDFTYKGIDFNFNYMDCLLSNEQFDEHCAKTYFLQIYDCISLSDELFSSLTINNSRMVNFAWSHIRISRYHRNNRCLSINHIDNYDKETLRSRTKFIYDDLNLTQLPFDAKEKAEQIKMFFGLLNLDKRGKEIEIKSIYKEWDNVKDDNRIIDWLNNIESKKNKLSDENKKEMIAWAWRHIKTKYYNDITPVWGGIDNDLSIKSIQQQKENVITFFDLMTNEAIKSSIISEFKTSASKAKYKILNNKKIHLNIPVNEDTKDMFDKIKTRLNLSNEELLIKMIHNENERLFKYGAQLDD